jgi:hypothetical protein
MIAPFTPAAAHSSTIRGTVVAGVAITARSISSATSLIVGNAFCPRIIERLGLTGKIRPLNDCRFSINARPTLPAFSLAPITATDFGANIEARIGRRSDAIVLTEVLTLASAALMIQVASLI